MNGYIILCYYQLESQVAWTGRRWTSDVSVGEMHDTEERARAAFRRVAASGELQGRDRAVVVHRYGSVDEAVVYHLEGTTVVAGPLHASA